MTLYGSGINTFSFLPASAVPGAHTHLFFPRFSNGRQICIYVRKTQVVSGDTMVMGGILKGVGALLFFFVGCLIALVGYFMDSYIGIGIGVLCILIAILGIKG